MRSLTPEDEKMSNRAMYQTDSLIAISKGKLGFFMNTLYHTPDGVNKNTASLPYDWLGRIIEWPKKQLNVNTNK